jgi:hypothetical protein
MQKFTLTGSICVIAAFLPLYAESPSGTESGPNKINSDSTTISTTADPALVGAGDIASCDDLSDAKATAELLEHIPGTIFANGDLAYPAGTDQQFQDCYGPTWGRFKARTRPNAGKPRVPELRPMSAAETANIGLQGIRSRCSASGARPGWKRSPACPDCQS